MQLTKAAGTREEALCREIIALVETARIGVGQAVNTIMTATYWEIGRRMVETEQAGGKRAGYGQRLLDELSKELTLRFGRGFSRRNIAQMRAFYLGWRIVQTPSAQLPAGDRGRVESEIVQTTSALSQGPPRFSLPWSHYVRLLSVDKPEARLFYEQEALRGGWSVRSLDRQISTLFYERTLLSKNKAAMLTRGQRPQAGESATPEAWIKDPFVLEFLDLKDEYSESDLEAALISRLEDFLLELGDDFAFVGRQRRLRLGDEWYRIDLLFFHRRLKCLVIIDLKLGKFTHADAGQMHLYLNYAKAHWMREDENPPVGLILCAQKNEAVAHYALEGLTNKVLAAQYRTALPDEKRLAHELEKTRRMLEGRVKG